MRPIDQAIALHQAGKLGEAEALYRKVLAKDGRHFDALHMLGIICAQRQQFDEAERLLRTAVSVDGRVPPCLLNYGIVLSRLGRYQEAIDIFGKTLALAPNHAPVYSDLGNAQKELGRFNEALVSYDKALAINPNLAVAHNNRGIALGQLDRYDDALASYDRALRIAPNYASAHCNRGTALEALDRMPEALAAYDRAIACDPNFALAHSYRGALLAVFGRAADALQACERAATLDPALMLAQSNHAAALFEVQRYQDVIGVCDKALALDARAKYLEALRIHAKMFLCDWSNFDAEASRLLSGVREKRTAAAPLTVLSVSSSASDQLKCGEQYSSSICPDRPRPLWSGEAYAHQRIRVAYLSADLRQHAVSYLMAGVFEQHDRQRFETFAFSYGADDGSPMGARLKLAFEHFLDVRDNSPPDIALLLRRHEIDIVVDLMGHTKGARAAILAARPAPIQVNYLGFPGTTGAPWIDYLIADRYVVPEALQGSYSEKLVYLPDTFQANDSRRPLALPQDAPARAELGLPESGFVFCCLNNSYKLTPTIFDVWMRLLQKASGSVLWMFAASPAVETNIRREAAARGVDPQRIVLAPPVPYARYQAQYRCADLFLDTLPFNAGTTASDALRSGVPVVTCSGEAFASRMAGSLLRATGLSELIATSLEDYEALALRLARDPALLAATKAKLEPGRGPLFDTARFTRHLEAAFVSMWQRHQNGERPESFAVDAIG